MSFEQGVLVRNGKVVGGISPDVLPLIGNVETVGTASKNDYSANTGLFINSLDQQLYVVISDISTGDILSPYPSGGENSNCVPASGYNIIEMIGELNADKLGDFNTTSDVTISGVTYHTYWEVAPTASNQVFGVAVHPTNGKLTRIYNNKGTYSAVSYDANTTTGDGIKTKVAKTGTAQSAISPTISASTTLDNAIGTLLNNDATLNADIDKAYKEVWSGNTSPFPATTTNFTDGNLTGYTYAGVLVDNILHTVKMGVRTAIKSSYTYNGTAYITSRVITVNETNFVTENGQVNDVTDNTRLIPKAIVGIH